MHAQTKLERERIINKIHDFCRGETMIGKGCSRCVLNGLSVCNECAYGSAVPLERLREAEKVIDEVITNG